MSIYLYIHLWQTHMTTCRRRLMPAFMTTWKHSPQMQRLTHENPGECICHSVNCSKRSWSRAIQRLFVVASGKSQWPVFRRSSHVAAGDDSSVSWHVNNTGVSLIISSFGKGFVVLGVANNMVLNKQGKHVAAVAFRVI